MALHEWQVATTGRYSRISRPIGSVRSLTQATHPVGQFVIGLHSQTILFILFAVMVGAGLLLIVPNLTAAPDGGIQDPADRAAVQPAGMLVSEPMRLTSMESEQHSQEQPSAKPGTESTLTISPVFTREVMYWEPKILEWSKMYNLDPDIIATIMQIESCGDPGAASYAGAQGLFQVMPFHFDAGEDMLDPDTNAMRGMAFFNRQLEYTGWDIYLSFAGYNGGYAASGSSYPYWASETKRYFTWAKGIYDDAKAGLTDSPTLQHWLQAGGVGGCQRAAERLGL